MPDVKITIDGFTVEVPDGIFVLEAAEMYGITIPHFCYHKRLKPVAACRLCLVEIEGMPGLQPSCATKVKDGMIVRTDTKDVMESHKAVLDFVLEEHPLDCHKCDAAGRCQLEDFTYEFGPHRVSYYHPPGVSGYHYDEIKWSPLIQFDPYKCVECSRCIRVCDEVQDCRALTPEYRGHHWLVTTFANGPLHCDFCGACASVCPTGAIEQQPGKFWKKDWELEKRPVVCGHCGHGCTLLLRTIDGKIARVEDDYEKGNNLANLCAKGRFGFDIYSSNERLTKPLLRRDGRLVEVTWDKALFAAKEMILVSNNIAGLGSGMLSIEDLYSFSKLITGRNGSVCSESRDPHTVEFLKNKIGIYGSTHSFSDISSFKTIVLVDIHLEEIDEVLRNDLVRNAGDISIVTAGNVPPRIKNILSNSLDLCSDIFETSDPDTLFIVDAERIQQEFLLCLADKYKETKNIGIILLAAQSNSRALSSLGYSLMNESVKDDAELDLLCIAGPVHLNYKPASVKRLIVSAHFQSEITDEADIVFPAAMNYEKPGTYLNSEGRIQFSSASVLPPKTVLPDAVIWSGLARECGINIPALPKDLIELVKVEHKELFDRSAVSINENQKQVPAETLLELMPRHEGLLLDKSEWLLKLREHLEKSREFALWF